MSTVVNGRRCARALIACTAVFMVATLSGCATMYVDAGLKDVNVSQIEKPARPQAAQLLFAFQTKGTANAKATEFLKTEVTQMAVASGLFATIGPQPAPNGAILSITINNVPADDAYAKGFVTGLTFGLAGNVVSDVYLCTVDYVPPASASKVTKTSRHAIFTTVGAKGAPPNAIKAKNVEDAVRTMTRQIVTAALKDLSTDAVFKQPADAT